MRGSRRPALVLMLMLVTALLGTAACSHRPVAASDGGATPDGGAAPGVIGGRTDRLRVHGTFCPGVEPGEVRLPIKLLFVVDTSQSMSVNDPFGPLTGKTGRRAAIENVIKAHATNEDVSHAIISFSHVKQVLTKTGAGLDGFTRDPKALQSALAKLDTAGGLTDFEGAWSSAHKLLASDMSRMRKDDPLALQHSTYVVLFLADGAPYPQIQSAADWTGVPGSIQKELTGPVPPTQLPQYNVSSTILKRVQAVMKLESLFDLASLRVHTFYLQGNSPASSEASSLLKSISGLGQGIFRSFGSAEQIDFLSVKKIATSAGLPDLKSLVVNNLNLLHAGAALDSDGDGLSDATEQQLGTRIDRRDTDGDGWSDYLEHRFGYDPLDPKDADCPLAVYDHDKDGQPDDSDGDGLLDCEERIIGTHSKLPDSDADGFDDRLELLAGTNPVFDDSAGDQDHDGVSNGDELRGHTSPGSDEGTARKGRTYRYSIKQVSSGAQVCYSYDVSNIQLAGPPLGANTVMLFADQMLGQRQGDHGTFRAACVRASPGPAPLEVLLPQSAWKRLGALDLTRDCVTP